MSSILVGTTFKPIHGNGMGKIVKKPLDENLKAFLPTAVR